MTHLLPSTGIGYAAIIFVLSACTVVVITFQLLMVVRGYKVISTVLLSLHALLFVFVLGFLSLHCSYLAFTLLCTAFYTKCQNFGQSADCRAN